MSILKRTLAFLFLPWLVMAMPWLPALVRRQWRTAGLLGLAWAGAWALMVFKWFGPGLAALLAMGLWVTLRTRVSVS
jgi:hypothetical protein